MEFFLLFIVIRTTKRPVPLEHCIFYSGESYKICENEIFLSHGLKAAKDASKKKTSSVASGSHVGASASNDGARNRKNESFNRSKQNKHSGSQNLGNFSGSSWGNQKNGDSQNNWGSRRSDASSWLLLINKLSKKSLLPVCTLKPFSHIFVICICPKSSQSRQKVSFLCTDCVNFHIESSCFADFFR